MGAIDCSLITQPPDYLINRSTPILPLPGAWGLIAGPLLRSGGILSSKATSGLEMLLWNLIGMAAIIVWNGVVSVILFGTLKKIGRLRVTSHTEYVGIDMVKHDQVSYPECEFVIS